MKHRLSHSKRIILLLTTLCLSLSSSIFPVVASTLKQSNSSTSSSNANATKSSPNEKDMHRPPNCKCNKPPFRRFVSALKQLEQDNMLSKEDFTKVMDALHQISRETLNKVDDKDQAVADALYKDKVLTEKQYKKISEILKSTAQKN